LGHPCPGMVGHCQKYESPVASSTPTTRSGAAKGWTLRCSWSAHGTMHMCSDLASRRRRTVYSPSWRTSSPPPAPHAGCVQAKILGHDV
jgi:hypothetical protein